MTLARPSLSIICVFNDLNVRRQCLDRSIDACQKDGPDIEYLPIDNVNGRFASAGEALNYGASIAHGDYLAFVHQDVVLHSLRRLQAATAHLSRDAGFGLIGAIGIAADGRIVGRIRDRVVLLGEPAATPVDVDSLDEVLFMARRDLIRREPLSESVDLAWHAYAVEYGLRVRKLGLRVGAVDIPLTHNSLTTNLARLDAAHAAVARSYPTDLPIQTTCGTITNGTKRGAAPVLAAHRWRYRWLLESARVHVARRRTHHSIQFVLSDIRRDIDDLALHSTSSILIANVDEEGSLLEPKNTPFEVARRDRHVRVTSLPVKEASLLISDRDADSSILLTNLTTENLSALSQLLRPEETVVGFHGGIGFWALFGPAARAAPARWREPRSTPFRLRQSVRPASTHR